MGNTQPKYFAHNSAQTTVKSQRLKKALDRSKNGKRFDFLAFKSVIFSRFERMPTVLCKRLYLAFAADETSKIDTEDFIAALGILDGVDRPLIMHFLFRIYEYKSTGMIDRKVMEEMLAYAYGAQLTNSSTQMAQLTKRLDQMFRPSSNSDDVVPPHQQQRLPGVISLKEFEAFTGPVDEIKLWVHEVLSVFFEHPSPRLFALERKFSSALEIEEMMSRFVSVPKAACDRLRDVFRARCECNVQTAKAELSMESWVDWCSGYIDSELAIVLFRARLGPVKTAWRFSDFADFCMVYGSGTLEERALALCQAFYQEYLFGQMKHQAISAASNGEGIAIMPSPSLSTILRRMVQLLVTGPPKSTNQLQPKDVSSIAPSSSLPSSSTLSSAPMQEGEESYDTLSIYLPTSVREALERLEAEEAEDIGNVEDDSENRSDDDDETNNNTITGKQLFSKQDKFTTNSDYSPPIPLSLTSSDTISAAVAAPLLRRYAALLVASSRSGNLQGVRELGLTACCVFGVRPQEPYLEKEYVMELMIRRQAEAPQNRANLFGPVDTEWCIIEKKW